MTCRSKALSRSSTTCKTFLAGLVDFRASAQLQQTAGICGDNRCGAGGLRAFHFFLQQIERGFRLRDVVDSGRTAANVRVGQFHEFDARNGAQQLARGLADFLAVEQVAGVLIGDADRHGFSSGAARPRVARNSVTSRTLFAKATAAACSGSLGEKR